MKFPRNARIFRGHLDAAPFATVFFLLVIFLMLGSLIYTPGIRLQLPNADDLPGTDKRPVRVALDKNGGLYYENQVITENDLKGRLREAAKQSSEPLMLVVQADSAVSYGKLVSLTLLARDAGISEAWLAALPRVLGAPAQRSPP
jgi:biopolymer transport protein ExbD